jgi:hypothetical protein
MNSTTAVLVAAFAVFALSAVWYSALGTVEVRVLDPHAIVRGRPTRSKALLELCRSVVVGAVVAGLAHACGLHTVGATVLLGVALWAGFPLVLLGGSVMWDKVPTVSAALHAGDWLLKLLVIAAIVGALR